MPCSAVFRLKRALVSVLLSLASAYGIAPDINRDSDDDAILQAYIGEPRAFEKTARGHPDENSLRRDERSFKLALIQISPAPSPHRFLQGVVLWEGVEYVE